MWERKRMQECSISSALAMETLWPWTKPLSLFSSKTLVTRVGSTDMRNINNPALQAKRLVLLTNKSNLVYQGYTGLGQMSVVLCLQQFATKIENCHNRHQRSPHKQHFYSPKFGEYSCCLTGTTLPLVLGVRQRCSRCRNWPVSHESYCRIPSLTQFASDHCMFYFALIS